MHENNHQSEYLLRELRITLRDEAKMRIRASLSAYVDFHTAAGETVPQKTGALAWLTSRWYAPATALLVLVSLLGGTSYASERSLPGSPFYMVKVRVTEPMALALATTPKAEADVHASHAERRLEEAAKLAVSQDLDEGTETYLEQKFSEHVDGSLAAADELTLSGKADESLTVRSELEARLVAHAEILDLVEDRLEEKGEEGQLAHTSTQDLLEAVNLRREVVSETRLALERDLEDGATASKTLALVTKASEMVPEASTVSLPSVAEHALDAGEALAEAKESLEGSRPQDARRAYRKALEANRSTEIISTLLKNRDILTTVDIASTTPPTPLPAPDIATTTPPGE